VAHTLRTNDVVRISSFAIRNGTSSRLFLNRRSLIIPLIAAGCASGARPAAETPAARPAPRPGPPVVAIPAPVAPVSFAYAAGNYGFTVTNEAAIELTADSGGSRSETRSTFARLTYRVGGSGTGIRLITGTVDSFTVAPPPTAGGNGALIAAPVAFRGSIDPGRRQVALLPAVAAPVSVDCGTPNQMLFTVVREAIVVPPTTLRVGQTWEDSTTSTTCRGDVPLTTRAVHRFRVDGAVRYAGVDALHVTRATTLEMAGEGAQRGVSFAVTGRGTGNADLYLDPAAGRFLGGAGDSDLELTVSIPDRGPQRFRQRGRTRVDVAEPSSVREGGARARRRTP
jgi:hypothetical protein